MDQLDRLLSLRNDEESGRLPLGRLPRLLSDATDDLVTVLGRGLTDVALVAVGGYGRREQCVHSDVDLLVLYRNDTPDVRDLLYPLWDARLKVGHSVRTVRDTSVVARDSIETLSALMDARLIAGDSWLFQSMERAVRQLVVSTSSTLRRALADEELEAQAREPYHTLSPDVKTSRGHLRTLQRVHWERRRQAMTGTGTLSERATERAARLHFLAVRNALHFAAGKAQDRLEPEMRDAVAQRLEMSVPELMNAMAAASAAAEGAARHAFSAEFDRRPDPVSEAGRRIWWAIRRRSALSEGSEVLTTAVAALRSPGLADLERAGQAGRAEWTPGDVDRLFEVVTAGPVGRRVWDALWRSGWLARELPEWEAVVGAPQLAPIHSHPVDGHLFRTVDEVLALSDSEDMARRRALDELGGPTLGVWAGFFHDIGKGRPGDHSEIGAALVEDIAARLHLPGAEILSAAVRHHLLLPEVATRRDIDSLEVVQRVVETVGDVQLLRLLYVLAAADGRATGTGSWTPWRAALVDRLYRRVLDQLSKATSSSERRESVADRLEVDRAALNTHADLMSPGYLDRYDDEVLAAHLRLVTPSPVIGEVRHELIAGGALASAIVVSRDVPGLAAALAAVCADASISILEGRFERRGDGIALDTFVVADARGGPVGPARFAAAMEGMTEQQWSRLPLEDVEVQVLGDGSIVEIRGPDRAGFLADTCAALSALGLDISLAKLDTRAGRVVDVFYVDPPLDDPDRLVTELMSPTGIPDDLP